MLQRLILILILVLTPFSLKGEESSSLSALEQEKFKSLVLMNEIKALYVKLEQCQIESKQSEKWDKIVNDSLTKLKSEIEITHKGYSWSPENGLVKSVEIKTSEVKK